MRKTRHRMRIRAYGWKWFLGIALFAAVLVVVGFTVPEATEDLDIPPASDEGTEEAEAEKKQLESDEVAVSDEEIDTSNWLSYKNEKYGYSFRYPAKYVLDNQDYTPMTQTDWIDIRNTNNKSTFDIKVVSVEEQYNLPLLGIYDTSYVSYILDSENYEAISSVDVGGRTASLMFFRKENPGAFGDGRDTLVAVVEHNSKFLIIKKLNTFFLDNEFKELLASFQLFNQ